MEDIFHWVREGNALQVRIWLDDTEHDLNQGDDHAFSPLHWACKKGHENITELLVQRGARVNATNKGDDTALHLAASHGHVEIVKQLLRSKADANMFNEHGNTPLHYACFWGYEVIAVELINAGALVYATNKYGEKPIDKCKGELAQRLEKLAVESGEDLRKISFNDPNVTGLKTRSRDATLSRNKGINVRDLSLHTKLSTSPCHEMWHGTWQRNDVVVRVLSFRDYSARITRDFNEEFPRLRIFSHPNILPVIGGSADPPYLYIVTQATPYGSLYKILHEGAGLVVDTALALSLAADVARGMAFLHSLDQPIMGMNLNSRHVVIDEERRARISMAHSKFSFEERGKVLYPQWMAPEALQIRQTQMNMKAADMWSYAILLWELATREVPFADLSPMEAGMKIALEQLRVQIPPGLSPHMSRLISICMNENPGRRPTFDMVLPILDKMKQG